MGLHQREKHHLFFCAIHMQAICHTSLLPSAFAFIDKWSDMAGKYIPVPVILSKTPTKDMHHSQTILNSIYIMDGKDILIITIVYMISN